MTGWEECQNGNLTLRKRLGSGGLRIDLGLAG